MEKVRLRIWLFFISYNLRVVIITLETVFGKNFDCTYWHKELADGKWIGTLSY